MVRKYDIGFVEVDAPITEPVTKFGGQPVWTGEPVWPVSRKTGAQMEFIGQVSLDPEIFGGEPDGMAYLFMTGDDDTGLLTNTWDPDKGENAVIVQSASGSDTPPPVATTPTGTGPSVRGQEGGDSPAEYAVELTPGEDPEFISDAEMTDWDEEYYDSYLDALAVNKIGGTPVFIQNYQYPPGGPWTFLLQLDMMEVPFHVNFGDAGMGYAFLSHDGKAGTFLWQSH